MRILVNGREQEVPEGATVAELIQMMGLGASACAAEVNKDVIPKRDQADWALAEGDLVELVTLVGGG
jgi:sulfur carrier protein